MKMKSKVQKMKRFLEAMGYTDDTDDDSDEFNESPNENHPDSSSAHHEMTVGNNQVSPEEINLAHRLQPEPTPFLRPNQQADSHHQCEPGSTAAADLAMWKQAKASQELARLQESQTREEHRKMVQIEFLWGIFVSVFAAFAGLLFFGGISSSLEARKTRKRFIEVKDGVESSGYLMQNLTGEWKTERIEELDCREHQIINPLPMRSPNAKPRKCAH